MKVRKGFVSNSSSSSFVIIDDVENIKCECCKSILYQYYLEKSQLKNIIEEYYGISLDEALDEIYWYKKLIQNGMSNQDEVYILKDMDYDHSDTVGYILDHHNLKYEEI